MLRPLFRSATAERLADVAPGRVDRRADWHRLQVGDGPLGPCALEILTCTKGDGPAGLVRDHGHAWIRLWRNASTYVSVGFYPDESTRIDPEVMPGLRMPGMLLSPDKYDRVNWPRLSTRVAIPVQDYGAMVRWIEDLQAWRGQGTLAFDLVDRNCVGFVVRAAARCGVHVAGQQPLSEFLPWPIPPGRLMRATAPLRRRLYVLGLALFGGFARLSTQHIREGDDLRRITVQGIRPIFERLSDLRRTVPFYHVRALQDWQRSQAPAAHPLPVAPGLTKERIT